MSRIELPDGAWAVLRDPRKVSERLRRPVTEAMTRISSDEGAQRAFGSSEGDALKAMRDPEVAARLVTPELMACLEVLNDRLVVALVSQWSFEYEISEDSLLDIPGDAYDALRDAVAPLVNELLPDMSPKTATTEDGEKIETHPFGSSSASRPGAPAASR